MYIDYLDYQTRTNDDLIEDGQVYVVVSVDGAQSIEPQELDEFDIILDKADPELATEIASAWRYIKNSSPHYINLMIKAAERFALQH
jgi:hypothetical protein